MAKPYSPGKPGRKPHADFLKFPEHQWLGSGLNALLPSLSLQLSETGGVVWRVLYGGAIVSLTRDDVGARVLKIRRRSKPTDPEPFRREVNTFVRSMKLDGWRMEIDPEATGIGVILYER